MVKIRMARHGAKKRPFYRIVAADSQRSRDGRYLEILGTFDPRAEKDQVQLKADRIQHWLKQGAQPSPTVSDLLKKHLNS